MSSSLTAALLNAGLLSCLVGIISAVLLYKKNMAEIQIARARLQAELEEKHDDREDKLREEERAFRKEREQALRDELERMRERAERAEALIMNRDAATLPKPRGPS